MADENALETKPAEAIPERPKEAAAAAPAEGAEGGEKGPSKGALKKAAKEKEKVRIPRCSCSAHCPWSVVEKSKARADQLEHRLRRQPSAKQQRMHRRKSRKLTMFLPKTMASFRCWDPNRILLLASLV